MSVEIHFAYINGYQPDWADAIPEKLQNCLPFPMHPMEVRFELEPFHNPERGQYHSTLLLAQLLKELPDKNHKIIGVTSVDLFIPVLTFVFGESQLDGNGAVISTYRLRNEFYGLPQDINQLVERTTKEALHELGHAFGLVHCPNYECVMNSSTYVEDIDIKHARLCEACQSELGVSCD